VSDGFAWRTAGLDWLQIWRDMYDAERSQGETATHPDMERSADQYATAAARFARNAKRLPQPDAFMRWMLPMLNPGESVIDIGAGSGRYVSPLAQAGHAVIAVEHSPSMRAEMGTRVAEETLTAVDIVADTWPTQTPIQADVVFAAHVLYAVRDIAPFLMSMHQSARRMCVLLLGARHPTTPVLPLWQAVHGEERLPLPAAYECLAALAQLGIAAHTTVLPAHPAIRYASLADAVAETCFRLRLPYDELHQAQMTALIQQEWHIEDNGEVVVPQLAPPNVVIWWQTT
jgi:SAM-dependent methyltransferase